MIYGAPRRATPTWTWPRVLRDLTADAPGKKTYMALVRKLYANDIRSSLGPHCTDQQERAELTLAFAQRAFARPDFIGWHWCGWMDGWKSIPGQELRQHSGLQDPFGNRYQPMVDALSTFSDQLYNIARSDARRRFRLRYRSLRCKTSLQLRQIVPVCRLVSLKKPAFC